MTRVLSPLAIGALLVLAAPATGRAYEDRVTLELGTGYAIAPTRAGLRHGPPLSLESLVGLSEAWSLGFRASYQPFLPRTATQLGTVGIEACYQIDVVHVVPRFSLGMAGIVGGRDEIVRGDFAVTARVGLDLLRGSWLLGVDLRGAVLPLANVPGLAHGFVEIGLRVGLVIDRY